MYDQTVIGSVMHLLLDCSLKMLMSSMPATCLVASSAN